VYTLSAQLVGSIPVSPGASNAATSFSLRSHPVRLFL